MVLNFEGERDGPFLISPRFWGEPGRIFERKTRIQITLDYKAAL